MAGGNLSPRQKMINMMYLVLTALLALNVSKEVLDSFFEVNVGIERTTKNFNSKNSETYSDFEKAVVNNKVKFQEVKDKAFSIRSEADDIVDYIQEMKYELVFSADKGQVYLGEPSSVIDTASGKIISDMAISPDKEGNPVLFNDLLDDQKKMPIAYLKNKSGTLDAGELFYQKGVKNELRKATILKEKLLTFSNSLIDITINEEVLSDNIKSVFNIDKKFGKKNVVWQEYNFRDMPTVGALTILSKIQSDVRNSEADVIDFLKRDIDAKSLKFSSAEGLQVPQSNFVIKGDSFRSEIFISAKNPGQNPSIYVGDYDSLGNGKFKMKGKEGIDYESVKVINGKGIFAKRSKTGGIQKWGGLIEMKTETGTKMYPFNGEYLVSEKIVVAAPTNMNVLYKGIKNPITVSVAGYNASQISVQCSNGSIATVNKKAGKYVVNPSKLMQKNSPIIRLFVTVDGKRKSMGSVDFKVKKVPDPSVMCAQQFGGSIGKGDLSSADGLYTKMKDFPFDRKALSYKVISYDVIAYNKLNKRNIPTIKGNKFNKKVVDAIKGTPAGGVITFTNIKAKLRNVKNAEVRNLGSLVFTIK